MTPLFVRMGSKLGNLNDKWFGADSKAETTRFYRFVDRIAGRMYTFGKP